MLESSTTQLIKQLKSQPRHGMAKNILDEVTTELKILFDVYKTQGGEIIRQNVFGEVSNQVQKLIGQLNILEQFNSDVQSGFNKNVQEAAKFGISLDKIAKDAGVNTTKFKQYAVELRSVFAGQTKFYKDNGKFANQLAKQSDLIRNQLGVSEDAYKNFVKYQGTALGRSIKPDDLAKNFNSINEQIADVAESVEGFYEGGLTDMIEGIGKLGPKMLATYGKMPKELGLAVLKTKSLGLELEKVVGIGKNFLDIESAIANEIEFQILSGEELLTQDDKSLVNEFQKAAYAQDANKQADLLVGFIEMYGEKLKNNVPLQELAANMFALSSDELFGAINQFNTAGAISKEIFSKQVETIGEGKRTFEQQAALEDRRSIAEKTKDDATKAYTESLGDYTSKVASFEDSIKTLNTDLMTASDTIGQAAAQSNAVKSIYATAQTALGIKSAAVNITSGTTVNSTGIDVQGTQKTAVPKQDVFIPAAGSGTIVSGPFGSFALDPRDDVLAMPNARAALASNSSDTSAIVAALQGMSFHVTNVFDGDKIQSNLSIRHGQTLNNINQV
jgi:hypothetical protein